MRKGILRMVRLCLIVCALPFFGGCWGRHPIHKAAYEGDLEKVKEIIEMDPNEISVKDVRDFTPLHFASAKGHSEIVKFLLNHGADIESEMFDRETPLLVAARFAGHGKYETIKTLLEHGAKVNHKDKHGRTALHYAAMYSGKEVINLLISYGADVNAKEEYQITPLHQAAMLNNIEAAKALVEHGADIFAKTYCDETNMTEDEKMGFPMMRHIMNKTAKEIALKRNEKELAQYLQTKEEEKKKEKEEEKEKETPKGVVSLSEQALWLQTCALELAHDQKNEERWFNRIGANDVIFMPKANPAKEILLKCKSVKPLSADKSSIYKKWLEDRIAEIQSITAGTTRGKVNQLLCQNGGLSTANAAIYSHRDCEVLKVRIEFEPISDEPVKFPFNENDKVKAVSKPYFGLFIYD